MTNEDDIEYIDPKIIKAYENLIMTVCLNLEIGTMDNMNNVLKYLEDKHKQLLIDAENAYIYRWHIKEKDKENE